MGPISDERGLEQGGVNSSDFYKIFGKEQLESAQYQAWESTWEIVSVAAIGQADDAVLVSNDIHSIQNLLDLTLDFCNKYHAKLCVSKTKLQAMATKELATSAEYHKATSPVNIMGENIPFMLNMLASSGQLLATSQTSSSKSQLIRENLGQFFTVV